jgi:hypothetical protein
MWEPRRLATLWASTACYKDTFTFTFLAAVAAAAAGVVVVVQMSELSELIRFSGIVWLLRKLI